MPCGVDGLVWSLLLAASSGHLTHLGDPLTVDVQNSRCSDLHLLHVLQPLGAGWRVLLWAVPSCPLPVPILCPSCASAPCLLRSASAAVLPQVCPPGDPSVLEKRDPPEEGLRLAGCSQELMLWCSCKGQDCSWQLNPRASEERLQMPLHHVNHCVYVQFLQLQHQRFPCSWQGPSAQRLS